MSIRRRHDGNGHGGGGRAPSGNGKSFEHFVVRALRELQAELKLFREEQDHNWRIQEHAWKIQEKKWEEQGAENRDARNFYAKILARLERLEEAGRRQDERNLREDERNRRDDARHRRQDRVNRTLYRRIRRLGPAR